MLNRRPIVAPPCAPARPAIPASEYARHRVIMALWSYQILMSRLGGDALRRLPCGPCGTERLHSVWADGESYYCFACVVTGRHPAVRLEDEPPTVRTALRHCDACGLVAAHLLWPAALGEPCAHCLYIRRAPPAILAAPPPPPPEQPRRRTAFQAISSLFF